MRRSVHAADLAKEAAEEAKRAAKKAKKMQHMAAEKAVDEEAAGAAAAAFAAPTAGGGMDVERPKLSHKQKIGVRKKLGSSGSAIRKPNRIMKKSLKKMNKSRSMEF